MKYGIFFAYWTHEWAGEYLYYLRKVKQLGFDILEISPGPLLSLSEEELARIRALSEELGVSITTNLGPPKNKDISSADKATAEAGVAFMTDVMKCMDKIGSRVLAGVINSYWPCDFTDLDKPAIWARGVQNTKRLCEVADTYGIDFCVEAVNRFETNIINTSAEGVQFCRDVGHKRAKILLDTFHMNIEEDNIADAIRFAGDYLGHLHVGESNRKVPGKGHLPWPEIAQALRDIRYTAGVVMEPFVLTGGQVGSDIKVWRDLSGGADETRLDEDSKASLAFLREVFA